MAKEYHVNGNEEMGIVKEIWESMGGDLWFITEPEGDTGFGYARLYSMPQFAEWGTINRRELEQNPEVWQISRNNWPNVNTYEDGILVEA